MFWSFVPLATAIGILSWSYIRKDFFFSYATMIAAVSLYFVIPGLIHSEQNRLHSDSTLALASLYVAACLVCGAWGWMTPIRNVSDYFRVRLHFPPIKPLVYYCCGVLVFAVFFSWMIRGVDPELLESTQWSGPQTIYLFFARSGQLIIPVSLIAWLKTRKLPFLIIGALSTSIFLLPPALAGKRDEIVELGMIFLVCWVLVLRKRLPKLVPLGVGVFVGFLFVQIGAYRSAYKDGGLKAGLEAAFSSETREKRSAREISSKYPEVDNFLAVVSIVQDGRLPNMGTSYWNGLVHRYIPGQIIGHENKKSLQFPEVSISRDELRTKGAAAIVGTTSTGFSDTLQAFSIFGWSVFYFTGRILRSIFNQAAGGSSACLFVYAHLLVKSGVGITHGTISLLSSAINVFFFVVIWVKMIEDAEIPRKLATKARQSNRRRRTSGAF